jgi:ABC-type phosphate transport system substrate-binding protein
MRPRRAGVSVGLLALVCVAAVSSAVSVAASPSAATVYRLVVNADNPITGLDRRFVQDAFLKKVKAWPGGEVIRPVDLRSNSAIRERFSLDVLRRPLAAIQAYWQQQIFSGRDVPPLAVETDAEVIHYLARYKGAIGYVSDRSPLTGARAVAIW